jgi:hypothetical protein
MQQFCNSFFPYRRLPYSILDLRVDITIKIACEKLIGTFIAIYN